MTRFHPDFDQLVFSGGGTRCFWQGGFLEVTKEPIALRPRRIAAVSGGALSACCYVSGRGRKLLQVMGEAFAEQDHNVEIETKGSLSVDMPHEELYRGVVERILSSEAVEAVAEGPELQITLATPPESLPFEIGGVLVLALYEIDLHLLSSPHMTLPAAAGVQGLVVDARKAARDGKLVDLVCAAAAIPLVFDMPEWRGQRVMDAGTLGSAPLPRPDEGRTLILLTRRYRNTPACEDRLYVAPSGETPADKIDFTDRAKIVRTWEMGRNDGKAFLAEHRTML